MGENTINIFMGAEDKVSVKDATQIIKLQGPKGEPGKDGKPFTYDMFTQEQLESLKGPKGADGKQGPKGEPFRFEDFTPEQLEKLKGPAGTGSNVDLSAYTTKKEADNLYLKKVDIRNYLTMLGDPKYALKTELNNYMPTATIRDTFVSRLYADNTYAKKTDLNSYMSATAIRDTFVSRVYADNTYAPKTDLNNYIKKTEINQYTSNIQLTPEQLEKLKGPKGDKGEDGRDGASATADNAQQLLLQGNVWCKSASVDDVLTALIGNMGKPFPRTDVKPLTFTQPTKGQTELSLQGEDHYKVSIDSGEPVEIVNGTASITIPAYGKSDIVVNYFNMLGAKVSNITIAGVKDLQFTDKNGITVFKEGNVLTVDLSNQTDNINKNYDISDRPAWVYDGVTEFKFISDAPNKIIGYAETSKIPLDKLYATLNTLDNPNIKTIYFQYGDDGKMVIIPTILKTYRSTGSGESRKVTYMGQRNSARQVGEVTRTKADYFAVLTEPFDGMVAGFGNFYKTAPDNE